MRPLPPGYNPGRPRPGMQQPRQQGLMGFPRPGIPPQGFPVGPRQIQQPGRQQPIPRDPGYGSGPIGTPRPGRFGGGTDFDFGPQQPGMQKPGVQIGTQPGIIPRDPGYGSGYSQYGPRGFGPMQGQGVGDPRLGAPMIPGNQAQMMMRGPQQAPMQQFSYGGRAGYQMGGGIMGLESLPVSQPMMNSSFPAMNYGTSSPMLNYGQTPLTMAGGGRIGYQEGGSPEEEMENIKQFYYGRRRGEQEDLLDEYQRFKMRKDFLRRYPRDEARFGGRMGYPKTGIGSLANRQGYFLGGVGDFVGDLIGGAGDILGSIGDIGGDIFGGIGDVLGSLDLGQLASLYNFAGPMMGLPPIPGMGGIPGGEGGIGSILGNIGSFMPQEGGGGGGGFNPYQFISNLIPSGDNSGFMEGKGIPTDVEIIVNLLKKFLTPESIAGTTAGTLGKLTYDEMKRLNALREEEFRKYKEGSARKKTQYRTAEGRETLPGYNITGVPQTTADVFNRAPAMRGGIMNVPTGQPRRNSVGVREIDYRQSGGFVPPIGIKEKADDIPAMLSNNEFVFTADAVRAAGGGSVNKGAQKMYGLMKQLEGKL